MKKVKNKIKKLDIVQPFKNGSHTFLFWLTLPILLVWISVGYIAGITQDKPSWIKAAETGETVNVVPYYDEHGALIEDLDQPFVTFWFDDAWLSQYSTAFPILKKYSFPASIAIAVNAIEQPNYMNWAQLRIVQKNGWETNSHSLAHDCEMDNWDRQEIIHELRASRLLIWKNKLGADIFVSPCGVSNGAMREEARRTYTAYRTVDPGFNDPENVDPYYLKVKNIENKTTFDEMKNWIDEAKRTNTWLILVFHKVGEKNVASEEDHYNITKENFMKVVEYVKESEINVVTPSQILTSQTL